MSKDKKHSTEVAEQIKKVNKNKRYKIRKEQEMKKVLLFLADGFEEVEALAPLDILRRGGVEVKTVSVTGKEMVTSSHNVVVKADTLWENLSEEEKIADLYFLPGGMPGAQSLTDHSGLQELIKKANHEKRWIGAICAAPMALGKWDLLKGKEAICYPGFESHLVGAKIGKESVVKDDNIITGRGVGVAFSFGYQLLEVLTTKEEVEDLKKKMVVSE